MEAAGWLLLLGLAASSRINASKPARSALKMVRHTVFGVERDIDIAEDVFSTEAEIEAMEACMPGCEHGWFDSTDTSCAKLHYRKFLPSGKPKSVVIFMHGIQTHSGKALVINGRKLNTALMADFFTKEGHALYGFDMYGHGYSEGTRFLIPSWEINKNDYLSFCNLVSKLHPGVPVFLMGESYGGTLTVLAARDIQDDPSLLPNFKGFMGNAPAIVGDLPPYPVYFVLRYVLAPLFPTRTPFFMPNPVSPERIWRDPEVLKEHMSDRNREMNLDGSGKKFSLGTALNMVIALEQARTVAIPSLSVPFCVVHGTDDHGVTMEGTDILERDALTPKDKQAIHRVEGAFHDILGDIDPVPNEAMKFYLDWMNKQLE